MTLYTRTSSLLVKMQAEPFLKWPGGKRWLAERPDCVFPATIRRYVEPFLGGGAIFFQLHPKQALLADANEELINAYRTVRDDWLEVERHLASLHRRHSPELYYRLRKQEPVDKFARAVRFIYLNRTCFNGIYRVNREGRFNVPLGSKTEVNYPPGVLRSVALRLRKASLRVADFEATIDEARNEDFVFVDPPYTVMHNNNNFLKYNAHLFSWADQERLGAAVRRAALRGARIMLSNADHVCIRELYRGFGIHRRLRRSTKLAADAQHRRPTTELIITNFDA